MSVNNININMNNQNYLPQDIMSLILNMRTESNKNDLEKKIEIWKEESEDQYIYLTNEIDEYFTEELAQYDHMTKIEDAKLFSPFEVLRMLREEKTFF
jgi:hypothetical protein